MNLAHHAIPPVIDGPRLEASLAVSGTGRPLHTQGMQAARGWAAGWASHVGLRHVERGRPCEDSIAIDWPPGPAGGLHVAVSDGVSAGACAAVASATAANHLVGLRPEYPEWGDADHLRESQAELAGRIVQADAVVQSAIAQYSPRSGAATFSAAWLSADGHGWVCRVGDCRAWRWWTDENGQVQLQLLGPDQDYLQMAEAPPPGVPPFNPARMIGNGMVGQPSPWDVYLGSGEGLLLTSDGIHSVLTQQDLAMLLERGTRRRLGLGPVARSMERLARHRGSRDDVAVLILVRR
jgi:serine/threonine protein phosphatase PrpC